METSQSALARHLFDALARNTADPPGITRAAYGPGEAFAHDLARRAAQDLGCEIRIDAVGNLYITAPGRDRVTPGLWLGSHLDSVPHGGNYDGAAGVIAGLSLIAKLQDEDTPPPVDITVMAIRAEEAAWFPLSYLGSRAAFGKLEPSALDVARSDTGSSLAEHMRAAGFDPEAIAQADAQLDPDSIGCFLEVHIEQGPRLVETGNPISIVSGIAGGFRYLRARCFGKYAHSGAAPRGARADAILGFTDFMNELEGLWDGLDRDGLEATLTVGRLESDPSQHGGSKVLGTLDFTLDIRSIEAAALERIDRTLPKICESVLAARGVSVDLGPRFDWPISPMDAGLVARLQDLGRDLGLDVPVMPSGAGHDAAVFADAGIPTAMIFIRNEGGSHNPDERMGLDDFARAVDLLCAFVREGGAFRST